MRLSYAWLKSYLPQLSATPQQVAEQLTMLGLEVDAVLPVADAIEGVVVGQISAIAPHPDADRLQLCEVDIGQAAKLPIVCGAANARLKLKVAVAQVGTKLGAKQDFKIKKSKIRGQVSCGMLCSEAELGMAKAAEGILELDDNAPLGSSLRDYLNLNDEVIEIDLTPNRGDCASVMGIARELAAVYKIPLVLPECVSVAPTMADRAPIKIAAAAVEAAPLVCTQVVKFKQCKSALPVLWQQRLLRAGVSSVHPVVDILNLVMLELGTPLHAYDAAKLSGDLELAYAKGHPEVTLLDGKTRHLQDHDLVVQDAEKVQALAGIMGAQAAAVDTDSRQFVLEAAFFTPMVIARSARAHAIHSDASYRFERGVDYNLQGQALARACQMLQQLASDFEVGPVVQHGVADFPPRAAVHLRRSQIKRLLGIELDDSTVADSLSALGMQLVAVDDGWQLTPPSWRFDIAIEQDLLEELLRMYGYHRLPQVELSWPQSIQELAPRHLIEARARQLWADFGFHEIKSYAFVPNELNKLFNPKDEAKILANPLAQEQAAMRTSLWPGLIQAAQYNFNRQQSQVRLFEFASCFIPIADTEDYRQVPCMGVLMAGRRQPQQWSLSDQTADFYDLKGYVERLLGLYLANTEIARISYDCFAVAEEEPHPALHPGQSAVLQYQQKKLGYIGKIHPQILEKLDIKDNFKDIYLLEIKLDQLALPQPTCYLPSSRLPTLRRDLALLLPKQVTAKQLVDYMLAFAVKKLPQARLVLTPFDLYQGEHMSQEQKSLALSLTFTATSRTLLDEEINMFIQQLVEQLQGSFGAQLRG